MRWLAPILLLALLVACTQLPAVPYEPRDQTIPDQNVRPDIPRTYEPEPTPSEPTPEQPTTPRVILNTTGVIPHIELAIPLGEPIGKRYKIVTVDQFPLLRHNVIPMEHGAYIEYDEEILFDFGANSTGTIIFGKEKATENIGTFLRFERDKPIFEYRLRLRNARFEDIQGRTIDVLGHTYIISEANNHSVTLFGQDIASNLQFENASKLVVAGRSQPDTDVRVTPTTIAYRLYTDGSTDPNHSILLEPGESLAENVGQEKLASLLFDLSYQGTPSIPGTRLRLDSRRDWYELTYDSIDGERKLPIASVEGGIVTLGKPEQRLHVTSCPAARQYCIAPGDLILLATRDGRSTVLEYRDASDQPKQLIMRLKENRYLYEYVGEPGRDAHTDIIIEDAAFRARIGPRDNATGTYNISVDLGWVGKTAELVLADDTRLRIHTLEHNTTVPLELIIPSYRTSTRREERIWLNLSHEGDWLVTTGGNFTLVLDDEKENAFGQTPYGIALLLDKDDDPLALNEAREMQLLIPGGQITGIVRLEG